MLESRFENSIFYNCSSFFFFCFRQTSAGMSAALVYICSLACQGGKIPQRGKGKKPNPNTVISEKLS